MSPWSLPNATKLPVKVTEPMRIEMRMVTTVSTGSASRSDSITSVAATSAEAIPPRPLNIATICGMAVI